MIRSILVALDGSEPARAAARNAAVAARWLGAEVRALFVDDSAERARAAALPITPGTPVGGAVPPSVLVNLEDLEEQVARRRREVARFLQELCAETGLETIDLESVRGRPADCIVSLAHQVDLLMLGRSGLGAGPQEDTLGTTTEAVLHHTNKPVLVSTSCGFGGPLVVAYDGRHPANNALAAACLLAEQARPEPPQEPLKLVVLTVTDSEAQAQPLLEEARRYLTPHRVQAEFVRRQGTVSEAIVAQVGSVGSGMVAMGAFGESLLREVLLGSHTRRVLQACRWPVLLVR